MFFGHTNECILYVQVNIWLVSLVPAGVWVL